MPRDVLGTLGNSDETRIKQKSFREIIRPHMRIVKGILGKRGGPDRKQPYLFIDMNAGCGWYSDHKGGCFSGSPVIALQEASNVGVHLTSYFIEASAHSARWLELAAEKANSGGFTTNVVNVDHNFCVSDIMGSMVGIKPYGLIYNDPSGVDPSYCVFEELSLLPQFRFMDVLIYVSATNIKRKIKAYPTKYSQRLSDGMARIKKKHWIIRKPRGAHQWTFLIGTNWTNFPVFRGLGFVSADSSEGKLVLDSLDLTKEEFKTRHCGTQMSFKDYSEYLRTDEFRAVRNDVMTRANGQCELCGKNKPSEVHHIKYPPWGTLDTTDNLKAVCHDCHCNAHGKEK